MATEKLLQNLTFLLFLTLINPLHASARNETSTLDALQQIVQGTVRSATDNLPLPGVSVMEKGTTNGVVTDFDGNFQIELESEDAVLEFSYVGFTTQEIPVANRQRID